LPPKLRKPLSRSVGEKVSGDQDEGRGGRTVQGRSCFILLAEDDDGLGHRDHVRLVEGESDLYRGVGDRLSGEVRKSGRDALDSRLEQVGRLVRPRLGVGEVHGEVGRFGEGDGLLGAEFGEGREERESNGRRLSVWRRRISIEGASAKECD
jgi:hypothetical protein